MSSWKFTDFLEPSWTGPGDFLTKNKDNFPSLEEFYLSLYQYSDSLKSRLTGIIHDDYAEFVSISKQLIQLGESMNLLFKVIRNAEKSIQKASSNLENSQQPLKGYIEKLHKVRHEHAVCELALEIIEHMQAIKRNLEMIEDQEIDDVDLFSFLDLSIIFAVVKAKMHGLDQPTEQNGIPDEYERLFEIYTSKMISFFLEFLSKRNKEKLNLIFNSALLSDAKNFLYNAFKQNIENSLIAELQMKSKDPSEVLSAIINYIQNEKGDLHFLVDNGPISFDFIRYSFWELIIPWIDLNISFPIGDTKGQMECYKKISCLFELCEKFCKTEEAELQIRNSALATKITSKLRLDLYAQLISNKILSDAEAFFSNPIQLNEKNIIGNKNSNSKSLYLKSSTDFVEFYSSIYKDDVFIIEQSRFFAVLAMKLIASFSKFALESPFEFQSYFVSDLKEIGDFLMNKTPEHIRQAMSIAINSLKDSSEQIRSNLISTVSEKSIEHLKYIGNMKAVGSKISKHIKPSEGAISSINYIFEWAKNNDFTCYDQDFIFSVAAKLLDEFLNQSSQQISSLQKIYETILKFRQTKSPVKQSNMFNIKSVQAQLKIDLDYIQSTLSKHNIQVDKISSYQQIIELLSKDLS